jgi:predicted porin
MDKRKSLIAVVGMVALLGMGAANAATIQAGKWKVKVDGNLNASFIYTECAKKKGPKGNVLCSGKNQKATLGDPNISSISAGLLPEGLVIGVSTTQNGYDIGATFGFYPGITATPSANFGTTFANAPKGIAFGTPAIDVRQAFATFGKQGLGSFKFGRDYSLFEYEAILHDMSIHAVGTESFAAPAPNNSTLGSIGLGYFYPNPLAQIDYTTPAWEGLTATVGVFQPLNEFNFSGLSAHSKASGKNVPGVQARLMYQFQGGGLGGFVTASGLYQKQTGLMNPKDNPAATHEFSSYGGDLTGQVTVGSLGLLGSVYYTKGLGTTTLFWDGADRFGNRRTSFGYLAQITYTAGNTEFGVNYGKSRLLQTDREEGLSQGLIFDHSKFTFGVYHHLTKNLILQVEATHAFASADNPALNINTTNFNLGAYFKF